MKRIMLYVFILLMVSGCATSPKEAFKVDCGPYPENFSDMITCYLSFKLDSPSNFKDLTFVKPPEKIKADTYYSSIPLGMGEEVWECFIVFDSKYGNGNFIGKDLHVVWIRDMKIVAYDYKDIELDFRIKQRSGDPCKKDA